MHRAQAGRVRMTMKTTVPAAMKPSRRAKTTVALPDDVRALPPRDRDRAAVRNTGSQHHTTGRREVMVKKLCGTQHDYGEVNTKSNARLNKDGTL